MTEIKQTVPKIRTIGSCVIGEYEPGNGTRYTAVAVPWTDGDMLAMGALGTVSEGWLVVAGNSGRAYLFQRDGYFTDSYIMERLGGYGGDYPYLGDLIRKLISRRSRP